MDAIKEFFTDKLEMSFDTWKDITLIVLAALVLVFLIIAIVSLIKRAGKKKRYNESEAKFNELQNENSELMAQLGKNAKLCDEAKEKIDALEDQIYVLEKERLDNQSALLNKESNSEDIDEILSQKDKEIAKRDEQIEKLQKIAERLRQNTVAMVTEQSSPESMEVNEITAKVLSSPKYAMTASAEGYQLPEAKTTYYDIIDVKMYAASMRGATVKKGSGKKPDTYSINNKTFAMIYDLGEGKLKITFKVAPFYGEALKKHFPFIATSTFPYGFLWFTLTNEKGSSLEIIKLVLDISYEIAKADF